MLAVDSKSSEAGNSTSRPLPWTDGVPVLREFLRHASSPLTKAAYARHRPGTSLSRLQWHGAFHLRELRAQGRRHGLSRTPAIARGRHRFGSTKGSIRGMSGRKKSPTRCTGQPNSWFSFRLRRWLRAMFAMRFTRAAARKDFLAVYLSDTKLPPGLQLSISSIQAVLQHQMSRKTIGGSWKRPCLPRCVRARRCQLSLTRRRPLRPPWRSGESAERPVWLKKETRACGQPRTRAGERWTNSLGMVFVPVPGVDVWFGIWDVRVQRLPGLCRGQPRRKRGMEEAGLPPRRHASGVNVNWDDAKAFCAWLSRRKARPIACPQMRNGVWRWDWGVRQGPPRRRKMRRSKMSIPGATNGRRPREPVIMTQVSKWMISITPPGGEFCGEPAWAL